MVARTIAVILPAILGGGMVVERLQEMSHLVPGAGVAAGAESLRVHRTAVGLPMSVQFGRKGVVMVTRVGGNPRAVTSSGLVLPVS